MIWSRRGGTDAGPLLVMLHGLSATADVWLGLEDLLPGRWPGGWLAADLPGHGRSAWAGDYSFEAHARAVAAILPDDRELLLLGHSMGGMVALALAGLLDQPRRVVGFSIKTFWPSHHVEGMQAQAAREPVTFATRAPALGLFVKLAGLRGLVAPEDPGVASGIVETPAGWRLAQDPATYDFGVPDMQRLLEAAACPVTLARGSEDHLVRAENLEMVPDRVTFDGLGHNPHVEQPAALLPLLV